MVTSHDSLTRVGPHAGRMAARALVLHVGALGDFVLALRVVEALRHAGCERIGLSGHASQLRVAAGTGLIDVALDWNAPVMRELFATQADSAVSPCQPEPFDLTINMLAGGASPPNAVRLSKWSGGRVVDICTAPRLDWTRHITQQWLQDVSRSLDLELPGLASSPLLRRPGIAVESPTLSRRAGPILIHPGSGGVQKCWPIDRFQELVVRLTHAGHDVQMILGEAELDRWPISVLDALRSTCSLITAPPLMELADRLAGCRLFIGNDSGVSHLAGAVGAPTVVIFGPTDPAIWRPLGPSVHTLRAARDESWPTVQSVCDSLARWLI